MAEGTRTPAFNSSRAILIIGAGIVGLTLAQGCREAGIPFQIFESHDASSEKSQGWGLTLHWSLNSLARTIGPEPTALLAEVCCADKSNQTPTHSRARQTEIQVLNRAKAASSSSMPLPAKSDIRSFPRGDSSELVDKSYERFLQLDLIYNMGSTLSLLRQGIVVR